MSERDLDLFSITAGRPAYAVPGQAVVVVDAVEIYADRAGWQPAMPSCNVVPITRGRDHTG